jgi:uncharacterized protein
VNDYAGLLRPDERARLESRLAEGERATGAQVVVAIFRSLEGDSLEDYSIRLAQRWRIGQKSLDNGVIMLIFVDDRKIRLEVGYGLESVIPDIVAGGLIRDTLAPRFREQRYAAGIEAATDAIYARIRGEGGPAQRTPARAEGRPLSPSTLLLLFLIFGVFGVAIVSAIRNASRRAYTAGRGGWRSHPPIFYGGGWPGGWSGGGGGGGGFSGGGGSFGGGGASGNW